MGASSLILEWEEGDRGSIPLRQKRCLLWREILHLLNAAPPQTRWHWLKVWSGDTWWWQQWHLAHCIAKEQNSTIAECLPWSHPYAYSALFVLYGTLQKGGWGGGFDYENDCDICKGSEGRNMRSKAWMQTCSSSHWRDVVSHGHKKMILEAKFCIEMMGSTYEWNEGQEGEGCINQGSRLLEHELEISPRQLWGRIMS